MTSNEKTPLLASPSAPNSPPPSIHDDAAKGFMLQSLRPPDPDPGADPGFSRCSQENYPIEIRVLTGGHAEENRRPGPSGEENTGYVERNDEENRTQGTSERDIAPAVAGPSSSSVDADAPNKHRHICETGAYNRRRKAKRRATGPWSSGLYSTFANRLVCYLEANAKMGQGRAGGEARWEAVKHEMKGYVASTMEELVCTHPKYRGTIFPCGSSFEGLKIKIPNEFDFNWELELGQDDVVITCHCRDQTVQYKARKDKPLLPDRYFAITLRQSSRLWNSWACVDCKKGHLCCPAGCTRGVHPSHVQRQFVEHLKEQIKRRSSINDPCVTTSGPAATIQLRYPLPANSSDISIDVSLAIPIRSSEEWPLRGMCQYCNAIQPREQIPERFSSIREVWLVPAGDYWRVSFAKHEKEVLDHIPDDRKGILKAIKYLREDIDLADDQDTGVLASYPLKVAFMKMQDSERDWGFRHKADRVWELLHMVEEEGSDGSMTGYFMQNDPLFWPADKAYMECRRMKQYLVEEWNRYRENGIRLLGCFLLVLLMHLLAMTTCMVFYTTPEAIQATDMFDKYSKEPTPVDNYEPRPAMVRPKEEADEFEHNFCEDLAANFVAYHANTSQNVTKFEFYHWKSELELRVTCAMGFLLICSSHILIFTAIPIVTTDLSEGPLYTIYPCAVKGMFVVLFLSGIAEIIVLVSLGMEYTYVERCTALTGPIGERLLAGALISAITLLLALIHFVAYMLLTGTCKYGCKHFFRYRHEFLLFDHVYHLCRCCCFRRCYEQCPYCEHDAIDV